MVRGNGEQIRRRTFLSGTLAGVATGYSIGFLSRVEAADILSRTAELQPDRAPAGGLDDVYIPTFGQVRFFGNDPSYTSLDVEAVAELLYRLDPSALLANVATDYDEVPDMEMTYKDTYAGPSTLELQQEMNCPACIHLGYDYGADDREWYDNLPDAEKFTWPDGSVVTDFYDLAGVTFTGSPHGRPGEWIIPSPFAPGTKNLLTQPAIRFLEAGFASVNFDATIYPRLEGLDFSRWAQASFRSYLSDQSAETLDEWGIENPETFDMREYIRSNDLEPGMDGTPAANPVVREYTLHHHRTVKTLWHTVTDHVTSLEYPAPEIGTTPNADPLWNAPVAGIYLHDAFDVVGFEDRMPTIPPEFVRDELYKLGLAAGRYDKLPTNHEAEVPEFAVSDLGFDPDIRYTTLMRLQAAEAYALASRLALNLFTIRSTRDASKQPIR